MCKATLTKATMLQRPLRKIESMTMKATSVESQVTSD